MMLYVIYSGKRSCLCFTYDDMYKKDTQWYQFGHEDYLITNMWIKPKRPFHPPIKEKL